MPENTEEVLGQIAVPSHLRKPAALSKEEKGDWRNRDGAQEGAQPVLPRTYNGGPEGMLIESEGEEPSSPIDCTSSIWLKTFGHRELPRTRQPPA